MANYLFGLRVGVVSCVPTSSSEVGTRQPCFVDIDHVVTLVVDREHLLGV